MSLTRATEILGSLVSRDLILMEVSEWNDIVLFIIRSVCRHAQANGLSTFRFDAV